MCWPPPLPPPLVAAEGVHSREAIDMVKEHVLAVLGPASMAFSNTMIKMSKLQAAQVRGGWASHWLCKGWHGWLQGCMVTYDGGRSAGHCAL